MIRVFHSDTGLVQICVCVYWIDVAWMIRRDLDLHTQLFDFCCCFSSDSLRRVLVPNIQEVHQPFLAISPFCLVSPLPRHYRYIYDHSLRLPVSSCLFPTIYLFITPSPLLPRSPCFNFLSPFLLILLSLSLLIIPILHSSSCLSFSSRDPIHFSFSSSKSLTSIPGFWKILCSNGLCSVCLNQLQRCVK